MRLRGQRFLTIINPIFLLPRLPLERVTVWVSRKHPWFMKDLEWGLRVLGLHPRCLQPQNGRLVDGHTPVDRTGG
jgi:hypothetical protein